jgi:hypothetical protein
MTEPRGTQRNINQARPIAHQVLDGVVGDEALLEQLRAGVEDLAKYAGGELSPLERFGDRRQIGPVRDLIEKLAVRVQEAAAAAGSPTLALKVSTSKPSSVTKIVCSHCADSD